MLTVAPAVPVTVATGEMHEIDAIGRTEVEIPAAGLTQKVNGRRTTLADPGAMVSATTAKNIDRFVTVVDTTDTVQLHSFSGRHESLLCLGSVLQQVISEATDGSLAVNVYKNYLLNDDSDIDIMSTDDLVISGGSIHFGTNEKTSISQLVAGQLRRTHSPRHCESVRGLV